ncbi:Acetyltransferase (GNAT) family protein [uncultured archaeon]|nr:Acetyltransferase (GNAT) family protein [uncultured archaeon]
MLFREMREDDIWDVVRLVRKNYDEAVRQELPRVIVDFLKDELTVKYTRQYLNNYRRKMFILDDDGIVGTIALQFPRRLDELPELRSLAIYPTRQGYGSILMENLEEYVRNEGFRGISVGPNPAAEIFYEKKGYETYGHYEREFPTNPRKKLNGPLMFKRLI